MKKRAVIKVHGKVQGVFFRNTSELEAKKLNLSGWVKNENDGTVGMIVEGEDMDLRKFVEWCKYGSDNADVEKVDVWWHDATGEYDDFIVK